MIVELGGISLLIMSLMIVFTLLILIGLVIVFIIAIKNNKER